MRKITRIGDLINLSNKKKYISFDLFDTLIRRRFIQANEVHDTVSAYVLAQIGHRRNRSPFEMTLLRYRVTDSLKSSSERSIQEPALNLIWDRVLLRDLPLPAERAAVVERTVSFEFAIEMANLALVEGVRDLLVRLKAQGKILVAATDMYFDAKRMRELLEKLEILDLFDHLYVSADVNLTKQTGALFERILSDLGISAASMLHVGDNLHSDIAMARKIGIMPVLVEQPDLLALERPAYGKRGHIEEEIADLTKMHLLSLLFDAQDRRVDHIYFMGRDGCAISQFFGEWESPIVGRFLPSPGHSDIFLNRALTCWGGIDFSGRWLAQAIDLTFWLNHGKATAREISDILGIEDVPAALGTAELHSASDTERAAQGYRDAGLADCIKASLLSKQRRLYRHLTDIGFFSYKSVAFSDVGYSGSALRDLNALFLAHSTDEDPVPPEMVLHLIATNDNYDANARRAFPFVDFSSQTIVPTALLPSELKQSFAWLEFFFKHPTLKPVLRFKETEAGLHPDLIHEAAPDKAMPGDRVREFGWARDADVACCGWQQSTSKSNSSDRSSTASRIPTKRRSIRCATKSSNCIRCGGPGAQ